MNDVIKELFERKSVRVYSDEMIEEDKKKLFYYVFLMYNVVKLFWR